MYAGLIYGYPRPVDGFYYVGQTREDGLPRRHRQHCRGIEIPFDRFLKTQPKIEPVILKYIVCDNEKILSDLLCVSEKESMLIFRTFRPLFPENEGWNFMFPREIDYLKLASMGGIESNKNPENRNRLNRYRTFENSSKGGKIGGQRNVETGQILELGYSQGNKNKESGHWDRVRLLSNVDISALGKAQGRINVESGHLKRLDQGKKNAAKPGYMNLLGKLGGKKGGPAACHLRWHINRGIVNPSCSLCK